MSKYSLNVFSREYYNHGFSRYSIKQNIKIFFCNVKYAYQRVKYGYCDRDVWALNDYYLSLMRDSIEKLKNSAVGYPGVGEFDTYEKWINHLQQIVDTIDKSYKIDTELNGGFKSTQYLKYKTLLDQDHKKWLNSVKQSIELKENQTDEALQMIFKTWKYLWD